MDKNNTFGKKLQKIRKARGLTQAKLAELAQVHEKHISKLELGTYMPNFNTLNKILKALNINLNDISTGLDNVSINTNPFYVKSVQILNNATIQELEFYYGLLKQGQRGISKFKEK